MAKLFKTTEHFNLKEEEKKQQAELLKVQDSVYKRIAEQFGDEIKFMRHLKKGKSTRRKTICTYETIDNNCESLVGSGKTEFKTISEVYRASIYLGSMIIFHMVEHGFRNLSALNLIKMMEETEGIAFSAYEIDSSVEQIDQIERLIDRKLLNRKFGDSKVRAICEGNHDRTREEKAYLTSYAKNIRNGEKPTHLFEKARKGRPHNDG